MICSQARQDRPLAVVRVFAAVHRCPRRHCRALGFRCLTMAACTRFNLSASSPSFENPVSPNTSRRRIQFCRAAHCRAVTSVGHGGSDKPKNAETYRSLRLASASDSPDASAAAAARMVEAKGHRMRRSPAEMGAAQADPSRRSDRVTSSPLSMCDVRRDPGQRSRRTRWIQAAGGFTSGLSTNHRDRSREIGGPYAGTSRTAFVMADVGGRPPARTLPLRTKASYIRPGPMRIFF
jgi:hypothetical protein